MPFFEHQDARLYYECTQSADAQREYVLFIHGLGLDLTTWKLLAPLLQPHFHLLLYDIRGHGRSHAGDSDITWDLLCEDMLCLMVHLGIRRVHIVGHGLGANIGVRFASKYPAFVSTLVLLSPVCYYPSSLAKALAVRRRQALKTRQSVKPLAGLYLRHLCANLDEAKKALIAEALSRASALVCLRMFDLAMELLGEPTRHQVQVPTLSLAGERDPFFPPVWQGLTTVLMTGSRFLVVPDASHAVQLEQPALVAEWIRGFIGRASGESAAAESSPPLVTELYQTVRQLLLPAREPGEDVLEVDVLHGFAVRVNGVDVTSGWNQRHAKQLLLYLILHRTVTREKLCDVFWPHTDLGKARNNLRVALNHLRRILEPYFSAGLDRVLRIDREQISIRGRIRCDLEDLLTQLEEAYRETDPHLKQSLCREMFKSLPASILPGLYSNWVLELRDRLESQLTELAEWMTDFHEARGEYTRAIHYLEIALAYQPADVALVERIIELYRKAKKRVEAEKWQKKREMILAADT